MDNIFFIVGPTAAGKHELALELARKFSLEIISIDAFKVYKHMDIGTAKPPAEILKEIDHHLINIMEPEESYSAGRFVDDTRELLKNGRKRYLAVGGTFLYYKALVYGMFNAPSSSPELRSELMGRDEKSLYEELERVDPESARRLHPNDKKRVARAIEVYRLTGTRISAVQTQFKKQSKDVGVKSVCILQSRERIKERIVLRLEKMLKQGLVDEVKQLKGRKLSFEAQNAICYKEILEHLDGKLPFDQAVERSKKRSFELARKQVTWIKSLPELQIIEADNISTAGLLTEVSGKLGL
jgi:tRNA dimethylallyltransferase